MKKRAKRVEPFESITAREWIESRMGRAPWRKVWGPLLRGKFGERAEDISMAWLWSKLTLRRQLEGDEAREEKLGYPAHWEADVVLRDGGTAHLRPILLFAVITGVIATMQYYTQPLIAGQVASGSSKLRRTPPR